MKYPPQAVICGSLSPMDKVIDVSKKHSIEKEHELRPVAVGKEAEIHF